MGKILNKTLGMVCVILLLIGEQGCIPGESPVPISTATGRSITEIPKTATPTELPIIAEFNQKGWFVYVCQHEGRDLCLFSLNQKKSIPMGLNEFDWIMSPSWSPDKGQIIFELEQTLYIVDVNCVNRTSKCSEEVRKIPVQQIGQFGHPAWSPDGQKIAYIYRENADQEFQIWVMNADGSHPVRLTDIDGGEPEWSPDGRLIAFVSAYQWEGGSDVRGNVFLMFKDGSNVQKLTEMLPDSYSPDWSPDGEWLVVMSTDGKDLFEVSNSPTLIKIRVDGSELVRLGLGSTPAWSPDGKYIAFIKGVDELWLMNTESTQTEKIDNINPLGEISWQPGVFPP